MPNMFINRVSPDVTGNIERRAAAMMQGRELQVRREAIYSEERGRQMDMELQQILQHSGQAHQRRMMELQDEQNRAETERNWGKFREMSAEMMRGKQAETHSAMTMTLIQTLAAMTAARQGAQGLANLRTRADIDEKIAGMARTELKTYRTQKEAREAEDATIDGMMEAADGIMPRVLKRVAFLENMPIPLEQAERLSQGFRELQMWEPFREHTGLFPDLGVAEMLPLDVRPDAVPRGVRMAPEEITKHAVMESLGEGASLLTDGKITKQDLMSPETLRKKLKEMPSFERRRFHAGMERIAEYVGGAFADRIDAMYKEAAAPGRKVHEDHREYDQNLALYRRGLIKYGIPEVSRTYRTLDDMLTQMDTDEGRMPLDIEAFIADRKAKYYAEAGITDSSKDTVDLDRYIQTLQQQLHSLLNTKTGCPVTDERLRKVAELVIP